MPEPTIMQARLFEKRFCVYASGPATERTNTHATPADATLADRVVQMIRFPSALATDITGRLEGAACGDLGRGITRPPDENR